MRHTALSLHRNATFPPSMADVRGFDLRTRDKNEKVGKIDDLVCATDGQVRYLDVELGGLFSKKRVLLPVGVARVDRSNDVVWVAGMTKEQVKALPDYGGDPNTIDERYEEQCCAPHRPAAADVRANDADLYDQGSFYGERGGAAAAREGRITLTSGGVGSGVGQTSAASRNTTAP